MGDAAMDSSFLKAHSLFGGLSDEAVALVKSRFKLQDWADGQAIIAEGSPNPRIHFILSGSVRVSRKGVELAVNGPGDSFGEMEFLDIMPAAATCTAVGPTRIASLTGLDLHEIYKAMPDAYAFLVMNLARDLSRRLRALQEKLDSQASRPPASGTSPSN